MLITPLNLKISYADKNCDRGIKWMLRCDRNNDAYSEYGIEAIINPKILLGIHDYLTAATCDDMNKAITNFNSISENISPLLRTFYDYTLKRTDYCVNFAINELFPECTVEQIMELIRRGNIPPHYEEWKKYNIKSHRKKASPNSFYLMNRSVHINCYRKSVELQERREKGMTSITQSDIDNSQDIIRFEVQCKYPKVYSISRKAAANGNSNINKYESLLAYEFCEKIIFDYFRKTIGTGHWYSLKSAISLIKSYGFNIQRENRLIDALRFVNDCHSVEKAKKKYQGDLNDFKRTLKELDNLGINPVTIPREWKINRIWNLLDAYSSKVTVERMGNKFE